MCEVNYLAFPIKCKYCSKKTNSYIKFYPKGLDFEADTICEHCYERMLEKEKSNKLQKEQE